MRKPPHPAPSELPVLGFDGTGEAIRAIEFALLYGLGSYVRRSLIFGIELSSAAEVLVLL